MGIDTVLAVFFSFVIGVIFGGMALLLSRGMMANRQIRIAQKKAAKIVAEAGTGAKDVLNEAKLEIDKSKTIADNEIRERRAETQRQENRLNQKEVALERKLEEVEYQKGNLSSKEKEIESIRANLAEVKEKQLKQLELISGMTSDEAKQELLDNMEVEMNAEASRRLREWEAKIAAEAEEKARDILSQVIQRNASEVVSETTVSVVPLPNDEMKGRLIGR